MPLDRFYSTVLQCINSEGFMLIDMLIGLVIWFPLWVLILAVATEGK